MAKKAPGPGRGRPKKAGGEGKPVRIEPGIATMARRVADSRGIPLSDYLSKSLRPIVARDYRALLHELEKAAQA